MENGRCSAASYGSATLRTFPTIAARNKKAIVFASLHQRWLRIGAADEARTRYLHLGKVALYQMSYGRILITLFCVIGAPAKICGEKEKVLHDFRRGASDRNRTNDTGIFSPLLYRLSYRGITGAFVPAPSRILMNRGPRKDLRSRGLWGRGGISAFAAAVLRAGLPGKPLTFRRSDPDRARTDDPQRDRLVL